MQINEEDDISHTAPSRKKQKKQVVVLGAEHLGFEKPEPQFEVDYAPRRKPRPKPMSEVQSFQRKFNFRSKFRFIVDASQVSRQTLKHFDGMNPSQWTLIQQVLFTVTSSTPVICPICRNTQDEMVAAQITACGHIYCWPCIAMHFKKSKKPNDCPICGEWINKDELKSCKVFSEGELDKQINFVLRVKEPHFWIMYHPETLQEDFNFSKCVRAEKEYILDEVQMEAKQLEKYMKEYLSEGTTEQVPFIKQAIEQNLKRQKALEAAIQEQSPTRKKTQFIRNNLHYNMFAGDLKNCAYIYQEEFGRMAFLHPICNKYLDEQHQSNQDLPLTIQSKVLYKEHVTMDSKNSKKYRHLNHVSELSEVTFVEVDMKGLLVTKSILQDYQKEIEKYKQAVLHKEVQEAKRIQERASVMNQRIRQKQMKLMQSEPWPIDTELKDLKNCNKQLNFPSLNPSISAVQPETIKQPLPQLTQKSESVQPTKQKPVQEMLKAMQDEFPQLGEGFKTDKMKGKQKTPTQNKKKKKKKAQAIDVTNLMLFRVSDDNDWD